MGKPFIGSQGEFRRGGEDRKNSLEIFGQAPLRHRQQNNFAPPFSRSPGSVWNDALRAAELLLRQGDSCTNCSASGDNSGGGSDSGDGAGHAHFAEFMLEDLIAELEAAEKAYRSSSGSATDVREDAAPVKITAQRTTLRQDFLTGDEYQPLQQRRQQQRERRGYGGRGGARATGGSTDVVSEELITERAAQWGYGLVLKGCSVESTPRSSGGSMRSNSTSSTSVSSNSASASSSSKLSSGSSSSSSSSGVIIPCISMHIRDALSSFNLAFLVCDSLQNDFKILYASSGFTTMTGYTEDEAVGRNCRFLQGPDTDEADVECIRNAVRRGDIFTGSVLNYKKDGTRFVNLLTMSPIKDDKGRVIKYIGMQAEQNSRDRLKQVASKLQQQKASWHETSTKPVQASIPEGESIPASPTAQGGADGVLATATARKARAPALAAAAAATAAVVNSLPKPSVALALKSSASIPPDRPSSFSGTAPSGADLFNQAKRSSQRYSLTSPSTCKSNEDCKPEWQAVIRMRTGIKVGSDLGFFEDTPGTSARSEGSLLFRLKNKSKQHTAKIFKLFRKDSSKDFSTNLETVPSRRDDLDITDNESGRMDRPSPCASRNWSSLSSKYCRSGTSINAEPVIPLEFSLRLEPTVNETRGAFSSNVPDDGRRQFCIMHT
uniref:Putative LOV domain-containing protein n=1 Tax=Pellia sp. BC-2016 TaxID=1799610 RepID=A0A126X0J4_9MARC|nr:putative LOV domain-containing protein [Pellia sp. BC-2016]